MTHFLGRPVVALLFAGLVTGGWCDVSRSHALDIQVIFDGDLTGTGFDDPIVGPTRQATFLAAAQFWADSLPAVAGATPVGIQAFFAPNFACSDLGITFIPTSYETGGSVQLPLSNVRYPSAFAKALDSDVILPFIDIFVQFNAKVGTPACAESWYYGTDPTNILPNTYFFYDAALHEIAHGLGIETDIGSTGSWLGGAAPDVYSTLAWRESLDLTLTQMTMAQRAESVVSTNDLQWIGRHATERARAVVSCGPSCVIDGGRFALHAPSVFQQGESVFHVDANLESGGLKELMVPSAAPGVARSNELTVPMLRDMGWACAGDCSGDFEVSVSELITAVRISLGQTLFSECTGGDGDYDGDISVDDLVRAVGNALGGCLEGPQTAEIPTFQAEVAIGSGQGIAGQTVSLPISVQGLAGRGAAVQLDLYYADPPLELVDCIVNVAGGQHAVNHELLETSFGVSKSRVAVHPDDLSTEVIPFADGVVATCDFEIAAGATPGNYPLLIVNESVCNIDGVDFETTYVDGQIQVCAGCGCE